MIFEKEDRVEISRLLVEFIKDGLAKNNIKPNQKTVAEELDVTQSMVAQINSQPPKPFGQETIENYAKNHSLSLQELLDKLMDFNDKNDKSSYWRERKTTQPTQRPDSWVMEVGRGFEGDGVRTVVDTDYGRSK